MSSFFEFTLQVPTALTGSIRLTIRPVASDVVATTPVPSLSHQPQRPSPKIQAPKRSPSPSTCGLLFAAVVSPSCVLRRPSPPAANPAQQPTESETTPSLVLRHPSPIPLLPRYTEAAIVSPSSSSELSSSDVDHDDTIANSSTRNFNFTFENCDCDVALAGCGPSLPNSENCSPQRPLRLVRTLGKPAAASLRSSSPTPTLKRRPLALRYQRQQHEEALKSMRDTLTGLPTYSCAAAAAAAPPTAAAGPSMSLSMNNGQLAASTATTVVPGVEAVSELSSVMARINGFFSDMDVVRSSRDVASMDAALRRSIES